MLTGYDQNEDKNDGRLRPWIREISRQTGLSRGTVRQYLRADRDKEIVWGPRAPRPTLLDPYKVYLLDRLKHEEPGKRIPNTVYLREMKARGYPGGETQLRRWLKGQREVKVEDTPLIRFETPPGEQVQIDWAVIRRERIRCQRLLRPWVIADGPMCGSRPMRRWRR